MRTLRKAAATLVLGFAVTFTACFDAPSVTQPLVPEPNAGLLGDVVDLLVQSQSVEVLHRTVPLAQDEVVSQVIGRDGGLIRLPEAGLAVWVPWGALRSSTRITVVAPAGDLVGYHFEPHGLRFRRDVTVVQDLTNTDASLLDRLLGTDLVAAYFEGELEPVVNALELLDVLLLPRLGVATFEIDHFSGYVIATN